MSNNHRHRTATPRRNGLTAACGTSVDSIGGAHADNGAGIEAGRASAMARCGSLDLAPQCTHALVLPDCIGARNDIMAPVKIDQINLWRGSRTSTAR